MKLKISLITLLFVSVVSVAFAQHLKQSKIEKYKSQTVLLSVEGLAVDHIRGTGILLDEKHVLTCFHMLTSPSDVLTVYTYPAGVYTHATPSYVDQKNDLAILVLESSAVVKQKPVFAAKVEDGEQITVVGNALGSMEWLVKGGMVEGHEKNFIISDVRMNHGDSGGPWFNDKGEIVAVSDWVIFSDKTPGMGGGVSSVYINQFFQGIEQSKKMQSLLEGLLGSSK